MIVCRLGKARHIQLSAAPFVVWQRPRHTRSVSSSSSSSSSTATMAPHASSHRPGLRRDRTSTPSVDLEYDASSIPLAADNNHATDAHCVEICRAIISSSDLMARQDQLQRLFDRLSQLKSVNPLGTEVGPDLFKSAITVISFRKQLDPSVVIDCLDVAVGRVTLPMFVDSYRDSLLFLVSFLKGLMAAKHPCTRDLVMMFPRCIKNNPIPIQSAPLDVVLDILWLFAKLFVRDRQIISMLYSKLLASKQDLTPFHICMMTWSLARFNQSPKDHDYQPSQRQQQQQQHRSHHHQPSHHQLQHDCLETDHLHSSPTSQHTNQSPKHQNDEHHDHHQQQQQQPRRPPFEPILQNQDQVILEIATLATSRIASFGARDLASISWAMAKLQVNHPPLFSAIAQHTIPLLDQFNHQMLSNLTWAFGKVSHLDVPLFNQLSVVAPPQLAQCGTQGIANIIWAFARVNHHCPEIFQVVSNQPALLVNMNPQGLANVAWAYATLGVRDEAVLHHIAHAALGSLDKFQPLSFSLVVWSFVRLDIKAPVLFDRIAEVALSRISQFSIQAIVNLLWGYARNDHVSTHEMEWDHDCQQIRQEESSVNAQQKLLQQQQLSQHSPQIMTPPSPPPSSSSSTTTTTTHSQLSLPQQQQHIKRNPTNNHINSKIDFDTRTKFLKELIRALHSQTNISMRHTSAIMCSLARLHDRPEYEKIHSSCTRLMRTLAKTIPSSIGQADPQTFSNFAWALAKFDTTLSYKSEIRLICDRAVQCFDSLEEINISCLAWALGKQEIYHHSLFTAMSRRVLTQIESFSPRSLSTIIWAHGRLLTDTPPELFVKVVDFTCENAHRFSPQALTLIGWALANLHGRGHVSVKFFNTLVDQYMRRRRKFLDQDLSLCAWSLVISGQYENPLVQFAMERDWTTQISHGHGSLWTDEVFSQLYQCHLGLTILNRSSGLNPASLELCKHHMRKIAAIPRSLSLFQLDVMQELKELGVAFDIEVVTPELLTVDVVLKDENEKVAIEVDGTQHFSAGLHKPLGTTVFKQDVLCALGWSVISINETDWMSMDRNYRQKFLRHCITRKSGPRTRSQKSS